MGLGLCEYLRSMRTTSQGHRAWAAGTLGPYLDASVATQVEVKLGRVGDFRVHSCACWNVSTFPNLRQYRNPLDMSRDNNRKQAHQPRPHHLQMPALPDHGWPDLAVLKLATH